MEYDVGIIGAGTGGYEAAIRLSQEGKKVVLIEKEHLGGVCLNKGCIPTKTLLKSAEKWQELQHISEFGVFVSESAYDWEKVMERKTNVIYNLRSGIEKLLKASKIDVVEGTATFLDKNTIRIETDNPQKEREITARNIIIATGSVPSLPPIVGRDLPGVITSDDILQLDEVPSSLVIVGAGAVGVEFAGVYASFGTKVTLVEMAENILPPCDIDVKKRMALSLRKQGIVCKTGALVKEIKEDKEGLEVTIEVKGKEETISAEKVLLASGRHPAINKEELDKIGVTYDRRGIIVDDKMETVVSGIYAVGDVTGLSMLAHSAGHQGLVAAENICGKDARMDYRAIPSCVFTSPEIAQVGLTEEECKTKGLDIVSSKFNFAANGKAVSMNETEGFVKYIADKKTHKILGCHIMGPHASDLIVEGIVAVKMGLTAKELESCIRPHPTLSETLQEASMGLFGQMIHQVNMKK